MNVSVSDAKMTVFKRNHKDMNSVEKLIISKEEQQELDR